ncbi:MAG TPA: rhodanese-like domain-containing protein [Gammaproteobacteria bacterium]|nr:rhodanese-like domain-containing protein [Gammaproteobacteria bacterium]
MGRLLLVLLALASGAVWGESPRTVAGARTIDSEQARDLFEQGVAFIDVRKDIDWSAGRIPHAVHLELRHHFAPERLRRAAGRNEPVVFYCNGPECPRSSMAARRAVGWGYRQVYYYRAGFPAWRNAGYPVE